MGFRLHKSFKILPGVRINLSKRGIGTSLGGKGFHVANGPSGTRTTASIPGTGVSFYKTTANKKPVSGIDNLRATYTKSTPNPAMPPLTPQKKKISTWGWIGIIFAGLVAIGFLCTGANAVLNFMPTSTPTVLAPTAMQFIIPILTISPSQTATLFFTQTPAPILTATPVLAGCDCRVDYNCDNFTTHADAQACFVHCGGTATNNFSGLDGNDHNGFVCEALP